MQLEAYKKLLKIRPTCKKHGLPPYGLKQSSFEIYNSWNKVVSVMFLKFKFIS